MTIKNLKGREVLDSRGTPTVEAELLLDNNVKVLAATPSGKSTGRHEACELRDGDEHRFDGQGVLKAVENLSDIIAPALKGKDPTKQKELDELMIELDGTENKEKLGANAILAASIAVSKAGAASLGIPLYRHYAALAGNTGHLRIPNPMLNVINGGAHADNNLHTQEFMLVPSEATTFRERLRRAAEIFYGIKKILHNKGLTTSVGDEGGYAPMLSSDTEAIDIIMEAGRINIGFDFASAKFPDMSYSELITKYPVVLLEDPLPEDDWDEWQKLTRELGDRVLLVGDDLFVTNVKRLQKGIDMGAGNAIIIKPNQIGTITEAINVVNLARQHRYKAIASHRSGDTEDTFIADFAVGVGTEYMKSGAPSRGERVAKYNRLLRIEEAILGTNQ
jgi:enolase